MRKQLLFPFFLVSILGISLGHQAAAQTLVASYPLNGNADDVSGNALNGVINGTLTAVADRHGNANGAMSFPGTGYISIADNPLLRPASISISCWVKVAGAPVLNSFVDKAIGNCVNDSWQFGSMSNNFNSYVSNSFSCGDFVSLTAPQTFEDWTFIVYTIDAVNHTMSLYANGLQVATGSYAGPIIYDNNPVLIGAAYENSNIAFILNSGFLDDVKFYDGVLSTTQIATQYFNEVATNKPGSGNAVTLDGVDDYVQLPSVLNGATQFTIDFWIKTTEDRSNSTYWLKPTILGNANNSTSDGDFGITTNGGMIGVWHGFCCGDLELQTTKVVNDNAWHHVAVVNDGNNIVLFVDGIQQPGSIPTSGGAIQNGDRPWRLGMNNSCCSSGSPHQGALDEIRFWNTALTQSQIRDRMCKKLTATDVLSTSLSAYYNFDETMGSSIFDKSGHSNYGVLANGSARITSGAPIGNEAVHDYINPVKTVTIAHANGESLTVTSTSGDPDGIHVYRVDEQPNTLAGVPAIGAMNKYFGVFQAGGTSPQYTAVYNYTGNPAVNAGNENTLALYKRNDNSVSTWTNGGALLNMTNNTLTLTGQSTEYILGSTGTLPLRFLSFTALKQNEKALLQWQTSDEINTSHFDIEHSNDGTIFRKIGIVNAADNSGTHYYDFTDQAPAAGINYYRLKQVDRDARYTYSPIATVAFEKAAAALVIFPNPAGNTLTIKYTGNQKKVQLTVFDLAGRQVMFKELTDQSVWQPDVSGLAKGTYTIRVDDGVREAVLRFVKM
ncbi:T9SS type A sorting domain-containing protein [Nostoc ellipsosporum NOK]|nr:T9SS type A sorting domain-containing protein [Nostoc ellipsosporum NOK]